MKEPPVTQQTKTRSPRKMARPQSEALTMDAPGPSGGEGAEPASSPQAAPKPMTKTALVLSLLQHPEGATLAQLVEATSWLPHTTRAALTGLKKKGHAVQRTSVDSESRYTVVPVASE
jgi:hypothetical protein